MSETTMTWDDAREIRRKAVLAHHPTKGIDPENYVFRKGKFSRPDPTPYKEAVKKDPKYILWADREWDDFNLTRREYVRVIEIVRAKNRRKRKRKEKAASRANKVVWD